MPSGELDGEGAAISSMIKLFRKKKGQEKGTTVLERLRQGLSKTRSGLTERLDQLIFGKKEIDDLLLEGLEEILFTSDLGVATTQELIDLVQAGYPFLSSCSRVGAEQTRARRTTGHHGHWG
jgi:signal recognition particle GTPase